MLEALLQLPTWAQILILLLLGPGASAGLLAGGRKLIKMVWTQQRKNEAQDHEQDMELSGRLETRLSKVEGRLDDAEKELRKTNEKLAHEKVHNRELRAALDAVIERVDTLLDRLENHETITEDERDRMTSLPPYVRDRSNNDS